jgi:hypothetical protein
MKIEIECFMSLPWLFEMRLEKLLLVYERERGLPFTLVGLSWGPTVYVVLRVVLLYFVKGVVWRSFEMR